MKVEVSADLLTKACNLSDTANKKAVIEKAMQFFIAIESQKKLAELRGGITLDESAFKL